MIFTVPSKLNYAPVNLQMSYPPGGVKHTTSRQLSQILRGTSLPSLFHIFLITFGPGGFLSNLRLLIPQQQKLMNTIQDIAMDQQAPPMWTFICRLISSGTLWPCHATQIKASACRVFTKPFSSSFQKDISAQMWWGRKILQMGSVCELDERPHHGWI